MSNRAAPAADSRRSSPICKGFLQFPECSLTGDADTLETAIRVTAAAGEEALLPLIRGYEGHVDWRI